MDHQMTQPTSPRPFTALALAMLVAAAAPAPAFAQQEPPRDQGFYLGLGLGAGKYSLNRGDIKTSEVGRILGATNSTINESDGNSVASKLFVGYNINRYFGVELISAGMEGLDIEYRNASGAKLAKSTYSASALALAGVARYEHDSGFIAMGKAGMAFTTAELDYAAARPNGTLVSNDPTADKTNFYWGLSAGYKFNPRWVGTLDYDDFGKVGDANSTGRASMRTVMASLQYRF